MQLARKDIPSHISENLTEHMSRMAKHLGQVVGSLQNIATENASIRSELCKANKQVEESRERIAQLEAQEKRVVNADLNGIP